MRVGFLGSKRLGLRVLKALTKVVAPPHELVGAATIDDSWDGRSELASFELLELHLPVEVLRSRSDFYEAIQEWRADVIVVCGWYRLIDLARFPSTKFYGFHSSLLPKYRGGSPLVWQILRGEPFVGVTLFQFADEVDSGPVIGQAKIPLGDQETIGEVLPRLEAESISLTESTIPRLLDGHAKHLEQDHSLATFCSQRYPEDGRIDWAQDARAVHDFVRAQSDPYPGAFTFLPSGERLTIQQSIPEQDEYIGVPGGVAAVVGNGAVVACGRGAIRVMEVGMADGTCVPAARVLSSTKLRLGRDE